MEGELRLGPYVLTRELVRAPGIWLFRARAPLGVPVVLQVARLRVPQNAEEEAVQADYIDMVVAATEFLARDPDVELDDHGAVTASDQSRLLYWALPWREDADHLGRATETVADAATLLRVARALLARTSERHHRGRLDPLLSESLLIVDERIRVGGLQIHLPPDQLSPDMVPARLAPEETLRAEPSPSGDLWRLGTTLAALAEKIGPIPLGLQAVLARLVEADPAERFPSAEAALATLDRSGQLVPPATVAVARDLSLIETMAEATQTPEPELSQQATALATPKGPKTPLVAPSTGSASTLLDLKPSKSGPEGTLSNSFARTLVDDPVVARDVRHALAERRASENESSPEPYEETLRDITKQQLEAAGEFPTLDDTLRRPRANTAWDKAKQRGDVTTRPAPGPNSPILAMGPQGTLVGARLIQDPTGLREAQNLGMLPPPPPVEGEAPGPSALAPAPVNALVPQLPPVMPELPPPVPYAADLEIPARPPARDIPVAPPTPASISVPPSRPPPPRPAPKKNTWWKPAVLAAGLFGLGGLAAAVAVPYLSAKKTVAPPPPPPVLPPPVAPPPPVPPPPPALPKFAVGPAHEVILEATPAEALAVSELDGRLLGPPPLKFLVPPGQVVAVLVAAPNHEPQRLLLPERGRVKVELQPLEVQACNLDLEIDAVEDLAAVSADVQVGAAYRVPGAALLRSTRGGGAWIVRCPSLGGAPKQKLTHRGTPSTVELRFEGANDLLVTLDDQRLGRAPLTERGRQGFVKLIIESPAGIKAERWLPVLGDTTVELPRPKKDKKPRGR